MDQNDLEMIAIPAKRASAYESTRKYICKSVIYMLRIDTNNSRQMPEASQIQWTRHVLMCYMYNKFSVHAPPALSVRSLLIDEAITLMYSKLTGLQTNLLPRGCKKGSIVNNGETQFRYHNITHENIRIYQRSSLNASRKYSQTQVMGKIHVSPPSCPYQSVMINRPP